MANGKYLPADNPIRIERDQSIGEERLKGATYNELCKKFNLTLGTIHNILHTDTAAKEVLETGTREMIARLPLAIQNYDEFLHKNTSPIMLRNGEPLRDENGKLVLKEHNKDKELREKVSTNIIEGIGILGSRTPMHIQNIYIDNRSVLSPGMVQLLGSPSQDQVVEDDIIEMDTEE